MTDLKKYPRAWYVLFAVTVAFSVSFLLILRITGLNDKPRALGPIGSTLQQQMLDAYRSVGISSDNVRCSDMAKSNFLLVTCSVASGVNKDFSPWLTAAGWMLDSKPAANRTTYLRAGDSLYIEQDGKWTSMSIRRPARS